MKITQSILTKNPCYAAGKKITIKGLMLHSVGCPQPSASVFIKAWNKESYKSACVHAFIDGNTGDVYQTLPWDYRGWHGGGTSNDTHIGVEMCEPSSIKYTRGSSFTCSDTETAKATAKRTYDTAVSLFAFLCEQYNLDPLADGVIISHKEGNKRGIASAHSDPEHLWKGLKMDYTMDTFRKAVKNAMAEKENDVIYRVQVGAYSEKANAEKMVEKLKQAGFEAVIIENKKTVEKAADNSVEKVVEKPETIFKVGDKVKMASDATIYGSTKKFASWIYKSTLYVREVSGGRIVISTQKTGAITGAVDKKYISKV